MNIHTPDSHTITLNRIEWERLLLALGMATWAGNKAPHAALTGRQVINLANAVNRDNPSWKPYKLDPDPDPYETPPASPAWKSPR